MSSIIKSNTTLNGFYNLSSSSSLIVKCFPSTLPYRVIEALSYSNLSLKNLTARIAKSGWAWFVIGRKLFVWRYLDELSAANKPKTSKCYELILPPSDIAHKAELVCVLTPLVYNHQKPSGRFPAAIAVSPEGTIRYWSNIFQENNAIDLIVAGDLNGQECQLLIDIQPFGCILGTTTNTLVHVCFDLNSSETNQSSIVCRTLTTPQGLFSGIGKKFSSFIFGSLPAAHDYSESSRQLIRIIRNEPLNDNDNLLPLYILVLFNCSIQKWTIEDFDLENFCGQIDLEKHLKEVFINKFWNRSTTHHNQISIWIMDITLNSFNEILLLSMGNNSDVPNENHFALVTLSADIFPNDGSIVDQSGLRIQSFQHLRNMYVPNDLVDLATNNASQQPQQQHRPFNLISAVDSYNQQVCYIYNSSKLYRINTDSDQAMIDEINFQQSNDFLLGAVLKDENLLLLTFKNGFVSIQFDNVSDSNHSKQLSIGDRQLVQGNNLDKFGLLKKALYLYVKGEKTRAELIVHEMFPFIVAAERKTPTNTVEFDEIVCLLSADICDQIPQADPRWSSFAEMDTSDMDNDESELHNNGMGSVIITNQLEEKLKTHRLFIELLKNTNAWDWLTALTTFKSILPTKLILFEHQEKLLACLALRKLHPKYGPIIDAAIEKVLETKRKYSEKRLLETSYLTHQDLFYREVTKVDDLFWQFIVMEESRLNLDQHSTGMDLETLILSITDIITVVFAEVCLFRQINGAAYRTTIMADCDYVPWASDEHVSGVRETWLKQFDLIIKCFRIDSSMHVFQDQQDRWSHIGQKLFDLADIILDSFNCQLNFLNKNNEKHATLKRAFESTRYKCLETLLRIKQYEKAMFLAEKYEDFDILIRLCEELDNQDLLQKYAQQFADKGFSECLFQWYLKEGKQGKMLSISSVAYNNDLDEFLSQHDSLKWLHQIHLNKFKEASATLKKLSEMEETCPTRRKTMLSIGKLSLLASDEPNVDYSEFDDQIRILDYQFDLSDTLLAKHNLDRETMKVLTPGQLVDILISGVTGPNEEIKNYQKALEIAEIVARRSSQEQHERILLKIWRKAFQKDPWNQYATDNLEPIIKSSFFYQLATTYFGENFKKLPKLDKLIEDFQFVQENPKALYFLRAIYETILDSHQNDANNANNVI